MTDTYIQDVVMAGRLMSIIQFAGQTDPTVTLVSQTTGPEENGDYSSFLVQRDGRKYRVKVTMEEEG